jgi:hypothetical protein
LQVHSGFYDAFKSVTNGSFPSDPPHDSRDIAAEWTALTGVEASEVTKVICAGHSLGAALATLCGPWAKSPATFPNVSPRLSSHNHFTRGEALLCVPHWKTCLLNGSPRLSPLECSAVVRLLGKIPVHIPGRESVMLLMRKCSLQMCACMLLSEAH